LDFSAGRKHDLVLAEHSLVRRARVHHVEDFGLVRDELIVRHRAVRVRVDLVHHVLAAQTSRVAAGGKAREFAAVGTDELLCVEFSALVLVEHGERLFLIGQPFGLRHHAVAVRVHLMHEFLAAQPAGIAPGREGHHVLGH
jgi:hypothetical protein